MALRGRRWRAVLLAVALGYVARFPANPLAHVVQPNGQVGMFEIAIGIAKVHYVVFAGLLGYHRPQQWLPTAVLPWPFVLIGIASVIAFRGTDIEPTAISLLLAPIITTLVGWRSGRAIRCRSIG